MKVCFPVAENRGLESPVYGHFGSAPFFLVVDTDSRQVTEVRNRDLHHAHGRCSPLRALGGHAVDAVVVGGIGGGALAGLGRVGVRVLRAGAPTVEGNLALLESGALEPYSPQSVCGGHGHGHGHGHGCSHRA